MTPEQLSLVLGDLVPAAVTALGGRAVEGPVAVTVERPRSGGHGDYATNVALQIGKRVGLVPRELAAELARALGSRPEVARAEVAGPGFVNVWLATAAQGRLARDIVTAGAAYGRAQPPARPERVNLEFVSANPTGPVHIGGVRWAAVGDALGRVLEAAVAQVTREYYFNDTGSQIERFALSLLAAARGEATPPDGYAGGYVDEIAAAVLRRRPGVLDLPPDEALEAFRVAGVDLMFAEIRQSLHDFGVEFDVYFNEKDLHDKGELDAALQRLSDRGATYEREGATWLRTTDFGDDKDRVLRKSDGSWTYFAADCAYYLDKRERGFDRAIYMLGADHHGYVGRLRAVAACFGDDPDATVEVLIGQLVNLVKDGEPVRMSKRAGTVVLLADLVEAIGVDAARYALARYSTDSPIDLDVALWARQTDENPVFSVQYAHARTCNVTRNAAQVGLELDAAAFDPALLDHPREGDLLGVLADYPGVLATAAELREVHRLARYLELLAGTYHRWYDVCRVIPRGDEEVGAINTTRLWLNEATRTVLANGLRLLGVTAPARM